MHVHTLLTPIVSLEEVRGVLGISQNDDVTRDAILEARISAAQSLLEVECNTVFSTRVVTTYANVGASCINLMQPFDSTQPITVEYKNKAGVWVTYTDSNAMLDAESAVYYLGANPTELTLIGTAFKLVYTSGFASGQYPQTLKEAMLITLMMWERQQAMVASGARPMTLPYAAMQLCAGNRDLRNSI
jgi:hypothetical protein